MKAKSAVCFFSLLTAVVAFAEFSPTAMTTLKHTTSDGTYVTAVTNAAQWSKNSGATIAVVAPCLPDGSPNPDAAGIDYYSTHTLRTFKADSAKGYPEFKGEAHWGGKSLHFGDGGNLQYAGPYPTQRLRVEDIHFHENSQMSMNANTGLTNSMITVESTRAKPFYFDINVGSSDSSPAFCYWQDCVLKGDSNAVIWMRSALTNNSHNCGMLLSFSGNGEGFHGTFEIGACDYRNLDDGKFRQRNVTYKPFNGAQMPNATFNLHRYGVIKTDEWVGGDALVGTVNLKGGQFAVSGNKLMAKRINVYTNAAVVSFTSGLLVAEELNLFVGSATVATNLTQTVGTVGGMGDVNFYYYYNLADHRHGVVNVTNRIDGVVQLQLDDNFLKDVVLYDYTDETVLLTYPQSQGTITEDDFELIRSKTLYGGLPRLSLRVDVEDGLQKVKLVRTGVVRLDQKATKSGAKFFADGTYWSDGRTPHNDADYLVASTNSFYPQESVKDLTSYMRSLAVGNSLEMWTYDHLTLPDLTLYGDASIVTTGKHNLDGTFLRIPEGQAGGLRPYGGGEYTLLMPLVGGGVLKTLNRGKAKPDGKTEVNFGASTIYLTRESPDFTGTFFMTKYASGMYPYTIEVSTKLKIAKPLCLGAPRATYTYDALTIAEYGCLQPVESMTLDDATRGIFFSGYGRFLVDEGVTFTVNERLTFGGTCEKCGPGTLWLGAAVAPKFGTAQSDTPTSGKNVLVVTDGALGVASKVAVEGLEVTFDAGTKLAVDANATGDAAKYGLYNKTGSVTFSGDTLVVSFVPPTDGRLETTVAVLSVPTAQAAAFDGKLVGRAKGYTVQFASQTDAVESGMTTFTATLTHKGFMIFLK